MNTLENLENYAKKWKIANNLKQAGADLCEDQAQLG